MKNTALYFLLFCFVLGMSAIFNEAQAQDPVPRDTSLYRPTKDKPIPLVEEEDFPDEAEPIDSVSPLQPAKAAFYSAVLPGLGQAYNGSHWKIPLIYIGGAFIAYSVNTYHKQYSTSLGNLQLLQLQPDLGTINGQDAAYYQRRVDSYRRERDYMIIIGGLIYGLNIVEAYVDAHLQDFNLNDDLSMRLKPALLAAAPGQAGAGIALTFHFK
jgi:hypothetical protein